MNDFNVLVLHRMGDPLYRREAVRSLEYMIPECRPDLNCIVHDAELPFPDYLKQFNYHLIVLGPTFLCARYDPFLLRKIKYDYSFVKKLSACKIALPQDDYDCSAVLDEWMLDWRIDCIYTVCPDNWDVLYPLSLSCKEIRLGYTGYISDKWIDAWKEPRRHSSRPIDVSYRASKLAANFGRIGQLKWEIAHRFKAALGDCPQLTLDISIDPKDMVPGERWHEFLENSRFCLATPSGSSLLDPYGKIRNCVARYSNLKSNATFHQLESKCFKDEDCRYSFVAISPRNIEAALAETVQIATPGFYSGLMSPCEEYIPLNEDCGNIDDVLAMMNDTSLVAKIAKQCKEAMLSEPRLRQGNIVNEFIQFSESIIGQRYIPFERPHVARALFSRYRTEVEKVSYLYWKRKRFAKKLKASVEFLGVYRFSGFLQALKHRS